ncbi:MAG: winged helix-turn-helix domain-containing protein [Limisphaerales bacterium]
MRKKAKSIRTRSVQPRFRLVCGGDIALGPGKAELLALIGQTGSINQAAKRMDMSYMRAWSLVQTMNRCFKQPLVLAAHGGEGGGGAKLTESGRRMLALYRQMEAKAAKATRATWNKMQSHLKS